jgi:hypothetical protein
MADGITVGMYAKEREQSQGNTGSKRDSGITALLRKLIEVLREPH